jgi:circadian clock protein KaiC
MTRVDDPRTLSDRTSYCTTGVEGLDSILGGGGLPSNRLYLIQGDPGVGKTTLALQFLLEGVRLGETCLYITLSETTEELASVARSHGWDISGLHLFELSSMEEMLQQDNNNTFFHPSEVELSRTTAAMLAEVERVNPLRVVFDSLSELRMLAETPLRYRRQILQLKQYFAGRRCTVLFLDDHSSGFKDLQIESITHGVIALHRLSPDYGISRRFLNVQKLRGVKFREGNHDLVINPGGIVIFPRLVAAEHHVDFVPESFPSGVPGLDALLGGGLDRGTSNMFMGPPGTNKSTLAMRFARMAAERGEKALLFIFDETVGTFLRRAEKLGMPLRQSIEAGLVQIEQIDPAEISPGELTHRIHHAVTAENTRLLVIDSINGYLNAMPAERYLSLQLHEMLAFLNQQGVITIMVLAQQGMVGNNMQASVDLTYLADTVLLLRHFEVLGAVKQAVSVIKKRTGNHERTIREIYVDADGIKVGEPLHRLQGVLTGVPALVMADQETFKPLGSA